jgi:hypothetical protein
MFYRAPSLLPPSRDRGLVALGGPLGGNLDTPADRYSSRAHPDQGVIHAESAAHDLRDPASIQHWSSSHPCTVSPVSSSASGSRSWVAVSLHFAPADALEANAARRGGQSRPPPVRRISSSPESVGPPAGR